jgi:Tfp pilus assembly protein PilZ
MAVSSPPTGKYSVIARLFELMNTVSEDRLLLILKDLLQDNFTTHIFKLVIDMTDEQQMLLLDALEKKVSKGDSKDRRGHSRKSCLIPLEYKVNGRDFNGYILDVSAFGVFIETSDYFFGGQEILMVFSVPNYQKPLKLAGEIVWSSQQGIGVKFTHLTQHQLDAIKYFSENEEAVYEITS